MSMSDQKRLGFWLSETKSKKLSLPDIEDALRARNIEPVKIDLVKPLSSQGPFDGILHKLTDFIARAELGDVEAQELVKNFQQYSAQNPSMVMLDCFDNLRTLMNRSTTYNIVSNCLLKMDGTAFVPKCVELHSYDAEENVKQMKLAGVTFPVVCKPVISHGSVFAHQMSIVFNLNGLREAIFPVVVQSFVNHNAVLFKLYVLGERYYQVERPSIRNFYDCEDLVAIPFNGREISKPNSSCQLNFQDGLSSVPGNVKKPCAKTMSLIVKEIRDAMGLSLFGVDVAIEASSGRLAVVDVNGFPSYNGVADFPESLANFVRGELDKKKIGLTNSTRTKPQVLSHGDIGEKLEPRGGIISSN